MTKPVFILVYMLCAGSGNLAAQSLWQPLNGPYGGRVEKIHAQGDTLFAVLIQNYLYYSTDNGLNWEPVWNPSTGHSGVVSIGQAGHLYATAPSGDLYRSSDQGQHWTLITAGGVLPILLDLVETPEGLLLAMSANKLFRSSNGGADWELIFQIDLAAFRMLRHNPVSGDFFTISMSNGLGTNRLHRFQNSGDLVSLVMSVPGPEFLTNLTFGPDGRVYLLHSLKIWTSPDGAAPYTVLPGANNSNISGALAVSPSGRIFVRRTDRVQYSDDGFQTVASSTDQHLYGGMNLFVLPDSTVFAGLWNSVLYRSSTNGADWAFASRGMRQGLVLDMAFKNSGIWMAYTHAGLFRTTDSGQSWELIYTQLPAQPTATAHNVAVDAGGRWWMNIYNKLFFSDNDGNSWTPQALPDNLISSFCDIQPHHNGADTILISTDHGFFRSFDRGNSWKRITTVFQPAAFTVHPNGRVYACEYSKTLFESTDWGDTWNMIACCGSSQIVSLNAGPDGVLMAGVSSPNRLYRRTENDTSSWTVIELDGPGFGNVGINPQTAIIAANGDVYGFRSLGKWGLTFSDVFRSLDGGVTWENLPVGDLGPEELKPYRLWVGKQGQVLLGDNQHGTWIFEGIPSQVQSGSVEKAVARVFPNPASDRVRVEWTVPEIRAVSLQVANSLGQPVFFAHSLEIPLDISTATWPPGIYFYQIVTASQKIQTGTLTIMLK